MYILLCMFNCVVIISDSPKGTPRLTLNPAIVAVEDAVTLTCDTGSLDSQPEITHYMFYNNDGHQMAKEQQNMWTTSFSSVKNSSDYFCAAENEIGDGEQSAGAGLVVQGKETLL